MDPFNERQAGVGHQFATNLQKITKSRYGPYLYKEREQQNTYATTKSNNYSNAIGSSINRHHDFLFRRNPQDVSDTPWQNRNLWDHDLPVNRSSILYEREWHDDNYQTQSKWEEKDTFSVDSSDLSYRRTERINNYERQTAYEDRNTNNIQLQNYSSNARRNRTWKYKHYKSSTQSNTQGKNATITSQNRKSVEKIKSQGQEDNIQKYTDNIQNGNIDTRNSKNTNIHQSITASSAQERFNGENSGDFDFMVDEFDMKDNHFKIGTWSRSSVSYQNRNVDSLHASLHNDANPAGSSGQEIHICLSASNPMEVQSTSSYDKQRNETMLFKSIEKSQNNKFQRNRRRRLRRRAHRALARSTEQPQINSDLLQILPHEPNVANNSNQEVQVCPPAPNLVEANPRSNYNKTKKVGLVKMKQRTEMMLSKSIKSVQNPCSSSSELPPCSESDIVCKNEPEGSIFSAFKSGPSNNENMNAEIQVKEEVIQNSDSGISQEPGIIHDDNLEATTCSLFRSQLLSISNDESVNVDVQKKEANIENVQNACFGTSQEHTGSTFLPLKSVKVENVQNIYFQSCSDSSQVPPYSEPDKTHDKGLIPSHLKSGELLSTSSNSESINIAVQEKENVDNGQNLCIHPCSSSLQVLPYGEPEDNKPESSICLLEFGELQRVSSSKDEELEMAQNEDNCSNKVLQRRLKRKMRKQRYKEKKKQKYKEKKKQRKQENRVRKGLPVKPLSDLSNFSLIPVDALELLSADGTDFLNTLGIATNLKIAVIKLTTNSYMCTLEGSDEFKGKAKEAVERFCNPMLSTPTNLIGVFSSVNCSKNSVQHILFKLNDPNISWKRTAETLNGMLEQIGKEIQIRLVRLQENAFPSPRKYQDCRRTLKNLINEGTTRYMILNSIIFVKLFVADAHVHMQVLQQWIREGADTAINNSVQESFNYIFKNEGLLNIDYKAVIKMLPNGAQALQVKRNVKYLMSTGTAICDSFKWGDKLKTLKRAYANIIINDYSDESVKNLNMLVMALQHLGSTSLPLKSVNVENVQNVSVQSCSDSSQVPPYSEPDKTHDKGLIPSHLQSGELLSTSSNNESINIAVQEKEDVGNSQNLCIQPCSSSLQVLPYGEPDDNKPEGSICSLESGDEELEMAQNEDNCFDKELQRCLKRKMSKQKYKEKKKQRKQENRARKGLPVKPLSDLTNFSLRPVDALKLLSADGTDFLNILGIATNLKITVTKLVTNSYMCTLEGSDEFKRKAKEAVERFCNPMLSAPTNLIGVFSGVNCSKNSVQQILFKLNDPNISWKRTAENLNGKLEQIGKEIQIRLVRLQENAFPSPRIYQDCRRTLTKLIKEAKTRYMILNSIILVKLFVADAHVHMQVLQQWIREGADTEINNSVQESFNYIFKNDVLLNIDYKAVMKMLPNSAQALQVKRNVNYLMTTGTAICDSFKWGDKLKTLKRAYANIIINDYSDESVKNLNMLVMALQQK